MTMVVIFESGGFLSGDASALENFPDQQDAGGISIRYCDHFLALLHFPEYFEMKNARAGRALIFGICARRAFTRPAKIRRSQSDSKVLELLQGTHLDRRGSGLGLERHFLLGEGVDTLACLDRRLAHGADLEQAGKDKLANSILLDVCFDHVAQTVQDSRNLLAGELGVSGDLIYDLGLGEPVFNGCDFLSHARMLSEPDRIVKTPKHIFSGNIQ
jgi:hypothetical protein